jgi:signal transduction histidine kinase
MHAYADAPRRWVVDRLGLADLTARLVTPVTSSRETAGTGLLGTGESLALAPDARLRIAAVIALSTGILFLPLEARHARSDVLFALLVLYGLHTLLTSFILIVSHTAFGVRQADRLTFVFVAGYALSLHAYAYLWPVHPGLPGGILSCLLIATAVLFSWNVARVAIVSIGFSLTFTMTAQAAVPAGVDPAPFTVASLVLAVGAATAIASARLLTGLRASLALRQRELTALSTRLMSAQEEERRRLSRELHDEFGQSLTAVNAYLWLIDRSPPNDLETLRARTTEARRVVGKTLASMRELSQLLRPSVLDDFGLVPSLDSHLQAFGKRHDIVTTLSADGLPERLPAEVETTLYRITQEALTNVARHANATRVRVALAAIKGELRLDIEDDGRGMPPPTAAPKATSTGLIGIRERAHALGGTMTISSGKGACLSVRVPLPESA